MAVPRPEDLPFFGPGDKVVDLNGVHPFTPGKRYQPRSKQDLVEAVRRSSVVQRDVRALGSAWSMSDAITAADVIDTIYLWRHLSPPFGAVSPLAADRIADGHNDLAAFCDQHPQEVQGRKFVHVEAGIKIGQLLEDLASCGLAVPTMGAGGGQSLAGALSTSTHGADFAVTPLGDWIRAVHLIGPLGQEWWITPASSIFTGLQAARQAQWPASGEILADDDFFDAVRVAVGRMGVIYSYILEVVDQYTLLEITNRGSSFAESVQRLGAEGNTFADGQVFTNPDAAQSWWPAVRARLAGSGVTNGQPYGLFAEPITDFDSGWLRKQVIDPTATAIINAVRIGSSNPTATNLDLVSLEVNDPVSLDLAGEFEAGLTGEARAELRGMMLFASNEDVRPVFDRHGLSAFVIEKMGLTDIASSLAGATATPLRHLNIVVSLADTNICWTTRRWLLPGTHPELNLDTPPLDEITQSLKEHRTDPGPTLWLLALRILKAVQRGIWTAESDWTGFFPGVGKTVVAWFGAQSAYSPVAGWIIQHIPAIIKEVTTAGGTSGEAMFLFLYRLATDSGIIDATQGKVRNGIIAGVSGVIGSNVSGNPIRAGQSNKILDVHSYDLDYTASGDSAEYLFDAADTRYLDFADAVTALAGKHYPVFGYMGIRFTPASSALIAMQRHDSTVSVEVATIRARSDLIYAPFWLEVHAAAHESHGTPHWGQEFTATADDIAKRYGDNIALWRQVLSELSAEDPLVFSTPFTRNLDLEPSGPAGLLLCDPLTAFLNALEGAADS